MVRYWDLFRMNKMLWAAGLVHKLLLQFLSQWDIVYVPNKCTAQPCLFMHVQCQWHIE